MEILPAIDLINGRCVRLIQGRYDRQINYNDDPVAQARQFYDVGAAWLHVVDLDGAKRGQPVNADVVAEIAKNVPMMIELGGGIRTEEAIVKMLDAGVTRLILGSSAIKQFDWFCQMAQKYPHKLVLGLDARGSTVATEGWLEQGRQTVLDFANRCADLPLAAIVCTDISKDGMLAGPNIERTQQLVEAVKLPIIAAGGVTTVEDVKTLKAAGVAGAIIGRALYEGTVTLTGALAAAR
ncbi:MAG: 1-(5-phosphoribosyl)-5-[(5-phosphoribosylamino)methylideneamino]imidazole-4-carboxamide isomerase [Planctomycetales bacterium]|nr:1-(5-phosphoribosyl)-5-[(5-phosphoribosylamino)methylideneamino]imidazole-4-carboxamide isomerase [Planctomycetales bacterium]